MDIIVLKRVLWFNIDCFGVEPPRNDGGVECAVYLYSIDNVLFGQL